MRGSIWVSKDVTARLCQTIRFVFATSQLDLVELFQVRTATLRTSSDGVILSFQEKPMSCFVALLCYLNYGDTIRNSDLGEDVPSE